MPPCALPYITMLDAGALQPAAPAGAKGASPCAMDETSDELRTIAPLQPPTRSDSPHAVRRAQGRPKADDVRTSDERPARCAARAAKQRSTASQLQRQPYGATDRLAGSWATPGLVYIICGLRATRGLVLIIWLCCLILYPLL
jgi:hypothetical protein